MYSFGKNPYISYKQDDQKPPMKPQEEIGRNEKMRKVDPVDEALLDHRLSLLKQASEEKVKRRGNSLGNMSLLRSMINPPEPVNLSRERLQNYSSTTLENIIKTGNKEKALKLIESEIRSTQDAFLEENSKRKKLAILRTLQTAVGDDMFFRTAQMQASELWRNMWGDESRNYESFIRSVRTGIEKSIHTGTVQVIKFDGEKGYEVVSLSDIRKQILEDVNHTDVGPFRAIVSSGKEWKKTLTEMLGQDAIAKIGLYLRGRYWNSRLINGLPNEGEVRTFFDVPATTYTNNQNKLIQNVYQKFRVDGIFEVQNIEKNFPTLLTKVPLENLPSLRKNPPNVVELCDDLARLRITNKQFSMYLDAFEIDSKTLENRAKARRDELLQTPNHWDIGAFVRQIPDIDKAIAKKFEGKKYPLKDQSVEQMRELFALLSPYKDHLPKELEPKFKQLFDNFAIFEDVKKAQKLGGSIRAAKVVINEQITKKGAESIVAPLTVPEKRIIEAAGQLHATQEENTFIATHTEPTPTLGVILKTLSCQNLEELSASQEKLEKAIKILKEKTERTLEEQNLLETLVGLYANNRTIDTTIAEIVKQTGNPEKTMTYISAATGGKNIFQKQIKEAILREKFHSEPTAIKNPAEKIYLLKAGETMSVAELPEFKTSQVSDYTIATSDDGEWNRTIRNKKGEVVLRAVPMMSVESVMSELDILQNMGLGMLEKHIQNINTILSKRLRGYNIDSYDGEFGENEKLQFISLLTSFLYPESDTEKLIDIKQYLRFYKHMNAERKSCSSKRMRDMGLVDENDNYLSESFESIFLSKF